MNEFMLWWEIVEVLVEVLMEWEMEVICLCYGIVSY